MHHWVKSTGGVRMHRNNARYFMHHVSNADSPSRAAWKVCHSFATNKTNKIKQNPWNRTPRFPTIRWIEKSVQRREGWHLEGFQLLDIQGATISPFSPSRSATKWLLARQRLSPPTSGRVRGTPRCRRKSRIRPSGFLVDSC